MLLLLLSGLCARTERLKSFRESERVEIKTTQRFNCVASHRGLVGSVSLNHENNL